LPVRPTPHWYGPRASARWLHVWVRQGPFVAPGKLDLIIDVSQHHVTVNRGKMHRLIKRTRLREYPLRALPHIMLDPDLVLGHEEVFLQRL
jgi:hypothetical protein